MKFARVFVLILVSVALLGCNERRTVYVSDAPAPSAYDLRPLLLEFHLIDSYGVDTGVDSHTALVLDPYHDGGLFEIDWWVDSPRDYRVDFRINDAPTGAGRQRGYPEVCGAGLPCGREASRLCPASPGLSMACGRDDS